MNNTVLTVTAIGMIVGSIYGLVTGNATGWRRIAVWGVFELGLICILACYYLRIFPKELVDIFQFPPSGGELGGRLYLTWWSLTAGPMVGVWFGARLLLNKKGDLFYIPLHQFRLKKVLGVFFVIVFFLSPYEMVFPLWRSVEKQYAKIKKAPTEKSLPVVSTSVDTTTSPCSYCRCLTHRRDEDVVMPKGGSLCGTLHMTPREATRFAKKNHLVITYKNDILYVMVHPGATFNRVNDEWVLVHP